MRTSWRRPAIWTLLPALLSLAASGTTRLEMIPNFVVVGTYHADLGSLWLILGLGVSTLVAGGWLERRWLDARVQNALADEREAQAQERRRFLRRLDHELKNPLTTIRLGIANLQGSTEPQAGTGSLQRISHQLQRLQGLVEGLRRLAELDEARLDRTHASLPEILEESVTLARNSPEWNDRGIEMRIQQVPWPVAHIWADRDLLTVAFRNLLENALKFTQDGDRVEVRADEDGRRAIVEVADTGPGIPPEDLPHVFDELYRGRNARDLPGSGLGLAMAKRIVLLHGGEIEVRSRVDQGAIVRVSLPLTGD